MKQIVKNAAMALAIVTMTGISAFANNGTPVNPGVQLKMTGYDNNQPVFQLNIENSEKQLYFISIKDQDGLVLYEETVKQEKVNRVFKLNTDELHNAVLYVEVSTRKSEAPVVFTIENNTRLVQETKVIPATK
jgi:hypothetical protein